MGKVVQRVVSDNMQDKLQSMVVESAVQVNKVVYTAGIRKLSADTIIKEQPLQIRLSWLEIDIQPKLKTRVFSITMRTPGNDENLIIGLLISEGVIKSYDDINGISLEQSQEGDDQAQDLEQANLWEVRLSDGIVPQLDSLERYQVTYSSCGLCGTTSLKSLEFKNPIKLCQEKSWLSIEHIGLMPESMRNQQLLFSSTGGSHAAALFDQYGQFISLFEDIGRHNALDKLFGHLTIQRHKKVPLALMSKMAVVVSGRISFEIVQKTVMAGIPVLIAVGAPSDLAIQAAKRFDLTLIGFASPESFNLYCGEWRLHSLEE